jgi:hypothetical protein
MWIDYNKVEQERDAVAHKVEQVKNEFDKVCKEILKVPMECWVVIFFVVKFKVERLTIKVKG